ncbi:hypothetical protein [Ruminococcus sp. Marseille-P6503]|uniref:hypothetical protein n=1 Tax=Ruminococcus sp. Marseille-P6503 TaxID=2364796 RepID=UPI000F52DF1E|nr:hypothetical protein [Ruminococcus sp. Marseille-P6503]
METITAVIIAGAVAIVLSIVICFISTEKKINELADEIHKLSRQLSVKDGKTLQGKIHKLSEEINLANEKNQAIPNHLKEQEDIIRQLLSPQTEMLIRMDERQKKLIDLVLSMSNIW